jgi:hypothetical protein
VEELIRAMEMGMEGKLYLSPEVSAGILEDYRKGLAQESGRMPRMRSYQWRTRT